MEEKEMKFTPVSKKEKEVVAVITPEAWDLILENALSDTIDTDQKMPDFAFILGDAVGGGHVQRKGVGVPGMRAILVDWMEKGNLTELETIEALDFLIKIFDGQTISLKPLAKKLREIKKEKVLAAPTTGSSGSTNATLNDSNKDGSRLGHMKAPQTIDDKEFYKMDHKFRGKAIIFNHIDFSDDMGGDDMYREGSKKDAEDLAKVLKGLGFEVDMYID